MALQSGLAAQIGYANESTPGTGVTVTRFLPLVSETMVDDVERLESAGIIAGRRTMASSQWKAGREVIAGSVQHELTDNSVGLLLDHTFGTNNTTGAGPYTHTMSPGDLTGKSFTTQIGRPDVSGTVQPFTFAGCKIASAQIAGSAGAIATLGLDIVGMSETTATALASASYGSSDACFTFVQGAVTVAGSAPSPVVSAFTLDIDNGLNADRFTAGSATTAEPLEAALRTYTGNIDMEFKDLTEYNRYKNATEAAVVLSFTLGANSLTITMNCRFDAATPNVSGPGIVTLSAPFKALSDTDDATAITAVLVNDDSTV